MSIQDRLRMQAPFLRGFGSGAIAASVEEAADRIDALEAALREIADSKLMIHDAPRRIARRALESSA
jgi:hypothetical protein